MQMFRRSRFAFAVAAAVAVSMSAARPALADEAAYERCLGDHTSLITNYIIKQCRVDMAKRTPDGGTASDALVKEEQTCEQTAPVNAGKIAGAECFGMKV